MPKKFEKNFIYYCENQDLEVNYNQITVIKKLDDYYYNNYKSFFSKLFSKQKSKKGFYLYGGVGVGKTMILNFFYNHLDKKKLKQHFNEFMLGFHDFVHELKEKNEENVINKFVKNLKSKASLIYFDEFQVTNIVDAMILGSLFKKIFDENIKVLFSSNIKINDLYKDGLQRDQFIPFIKIIQNRCYQEKLNIKEDYRKSQSINNKRFFYPLNEKTNFKVNKYFRQVTKNIKMKEKVLIIKGRKFKIKNYYNGISRFDFKDLCAKNIAAEDFIKIAEVCNFLIIENIPNFNNNNSNQQHRFITLIDILYEKKRPLMVTSKTKLNLITSSRNLEDAFKRTISRLYELTSIKYH